MHVRSLTLWCLVAIVCLSALGPAQPSAAATEYYLSYRGDLGADFYGRTQVLDDRYLYAFIEVVPAPIGELGEYHLTSYDLTTLREVGREPYYTLSETFILDNGAVYATLHGGNYYAFYINIKDRYRRDMILKSAEGHDNYYLTYTLKAGSYKQVYVYNVKTASSTMVTTNNANHMSPRISGDNVVFLQYNNDYDLYLVDKSGGMMVPISTMTGDEGAPLIDGNDVVFSLTSGGKTALYHLDLATMTKTKLADRVGTYTVKDGRVLFYDTDDAEWYVYVKEMGRLLSTGLTGDTSSIAVSQSWVVVGGHVFSIRAGTPVTTPAPTTAPPTTTQPPTTVAPTTTPAPTTPPSLEYVEEELVISLAPGSQLRPFVYGSIIVWTDTRSDDGDVYGYDLDREREFSIAVKQGEQGYPARIWGDYVTWHDNRSGSWDIYLFDLSTREESVIIDAPGSQAYASCYGTYIVYHDKRGATWDIYCYDLSTKEEFAICTAPGDQNRPFIYGDIVVWCDGREDAKAIYGYNLETGEEFRIGESARTPDYPRVYGDIVVWHDYRNEDWDIYGYNMATEEEFAVCTAPGTQNHPAIYGNIVAWEDSRDGEKNIYAAVLSFGKPPDSGSSGGGNILLLVGAVVVVAALAVGALFFKKSRKP